MKTVTIVQNSMKTTVIFRLSLIRRLISDGYRVNILALNDCDNSLIELKKIGCDVYPIDGFKSVSEFIKYLASLNYKYLQLAKSTDVFLVFFIISYLLILPGSMVKKARMIVSIEGLGTIFMRSRILCKLLKFLLSRKNITRLFCNKDENRLLGREGDTITNGIGIELSKFRGVKVLNESKTTKLLYVGRLIKDKGVLDAVECLRQLLDIGVNASLDLVGDIYPDNPSSLTNQQISHFREEFGDNIKFHGFVSDTVPYYLSSDILLLPSLREGFPVCVMEANACGVPAIVYDVPGSQDAIVSYVNGQVVPYGDIGLIKKAVVEIKSNYEEYSRKSRGYALVNFDCESKNSLFLNAIKYKLQFDEARF
ncbi:MAG: glycosyltransferase family 4 protein [Vibrionaceae bacterium]|nr:glycosyltransferase family 4 protein [Vibrionaceae bacterium]